jgi:DNA invertase Pin-like site-specific DNA recombinase
LEVIPPPNMSDRSQLRVDTIRENMQRGLDYARSQGRVGGRPSVMTPERIATAERMRAENQSWESIRRVLGVGPRAFAVHLLDGTIHRVLDRMFYRRWSE